MTPRILSVIPPLTQLNTPYPATAYLTGFLRARGFQAAQDDLALKLVLRLFSRAGLERVQAAASALPKAQRSPAVRHFLHEYVRIRRIVEPAIAYLQGRDPSLATRIAGMANSLPIRLGMPLISATNSARRASR